MTLDTLEHRHQPGANGEQFYTENLDSVGEIFLIPYLDGYFLYVPRIGVLALIDNDLVARLRQEVSEFGVKSDALLELAEELDFPESWQTILSQKPSPKEWKPVSLTFSNTQKCTLRCRYCYADGGRLDDADIDPGVAEAAIRLIVENAVARGEQPGITFLGEGEATANWHGFQRIIEFFKTQCINRGLTPYVQLSTNGVFSLNKVPYIIENCNSVTFSVDGIASAHDAHRILPNGKGSFSQIAATMAEFDRLGKAYGVRTTATQTATDGLCEFIQWMGEHTCCKEVHIEPVFNMNGLARTAEYTAHPESERFVSAFRDARRIAARYDITLYYSSATTGTRNWFCGAYNASNFLITSKGMVTACNEVMREDDPRAKLFKYGLWSAEENKFIFDTEAIAKLARLNVHEIPKCQGCFAKYNCAGDCYAKSMKGNGDPWSDGYTPRCEVTRELLKDNLALELMKVRASDTSL